MGRPALLSIALLLAIVVLTPASTSAQSAPAAAGAQSDTPPAPEIPVRDFVELAGVLRTGDRVDIVDVRNRWLRGRLRAAMPTGLVLSVRGHDERIDAGDVQQVRRFEADPVRDGFLKGGAVGAGLGAAVLAGGCHDASGCASALVSNVLTFSLIGAYIDWRNQRAPVVFARQAGTVLRQRPRADVTFAFGGVRLDLGPGRYPLNSPGYAAPRDAPSLEGAVAWRWTPRTATEFEIACLCYDRTDTFDGQIVETATSHTLIWYEHHYRLLRPSISQLYSPWPDRRWQPYVGVGLAVNVQSSYDERSARPPAPGPLTTRDRDGYRAQGVTISPAELPIDGFSTDTITTTRTHVFGRLGLKVTVTPRAFLTIESQVGRRVVPIRGGIGIMMF
ncbi:MAG: hypothetical protein IT184_15605 [Acidobacteria bacterium]|nr:hypothetical protein [Acidobacteriota bacterium]